MSEADHQTCEEAGGGEHPAAAADIMIAEDTAELRAKLCDAWRGLIDRLLESDHSSAAVAETMFEVATEQLTALHGASGAANYMHLLADQMLNAANERSRALVGG